MTFDQLAKDNPMGKNTILLRGKKIKKSSKTNSKPSNLKTRSKQAQDKLKTSSSSKEAQNQPKQTQNKLKSSLGALLKLVLSMFSTIFRRSVENTSYVATSPPRRHVAATPPLRRLHKRVLKTNSEKPQHS